jgi:hypothetical protein
MSVTLWELHRLYIQKELQKETAQLINDIKTQAMEQLRQLFKANHVFNLSAIERKAGIRKLKLHEFVNGKAELSYSECMKINKIVENATKLQK